VITVYIERPLAVCGNSVCEAGEDSACASDCHPDGWVRTFPVVLSEHTNPASRADDGDHTIASPLFATLSALGADNTVVLAGGAAGSVDLGGGPLAPGSAGDELGVLAKYDADGRLLWARRFGSFAAFLIGGVGITSDGTIVVHGAPQYDEHSVWIWRFAPNGELISSRMLLTGPAHLTGPPLFDGDGNIFFLVGSIATPVSFGPFTLTNVGTPVVKTTADGDPLWVASIPGTIGASAALDANGDLVLAGGRRDTETTGLFKLNGGDGTVLWARRGLHLAVNIDAHGDVYASGPLMNPQQSLALPRDAYDFPLPESAGRGDFFVAKYSGGDGAAMALYTVPMSCRSTVPFAPCQGRFDGRNLVFDGAGNLVVAIVGGNRAPIDFGLGRFETYLTRDLFVASLTPELALRWIKHAPMILDGATRGLAVDGRGHVVLSGTFAGSMLIDDRLVVNNIPERRGNGNTFLASFRAPLPSDTTPPVLDHLPQNMFIQATSAAGAQVFFMPPTAIDEGYAGVNVSCMPAPNTTFGVGTTPVTCTAADPLGNRASASFAITVVDTLAPELAGLDPISVEATGPSGAVVHFAPTALDLVDGTRAVSCDHASGGVFPQGTTTVTCSASDTRGNTAMGSFTVRVSYHWSGILQPVNADGTSIFRLGSTIPVKFRVISDAGPIVDVVARLTVARVSGTPTGTVVESDVLAAGVAGGTFRYDATNDQYIYNLSTRSLTTGTWRLTIDLGDGVARTAVISLRK
jgi:hypothetical protein